MSAVAKPANDAPLRHEPYDIDVEQVLLGACLENNRAHLIAATVLSAEDFYDPLHSRMWAEIERLLGADMVVTPLTLFAAMKSDPGLIEVGGVAYLAGLLQASRAMTRVLDLARILHDHAIRRRAITALADAAEQLYAPNIPVLQALSPLVTIADRTASENESRSGSSEAGDAAHALMKELESREDGKMAGVSTGLRRVDDLLGGLYPENLIIVAGRPGMGKSTQGTNLARAAAAAGVQVEYFSLEMSKRELSARLVCDLDFDKRQNATTVPVHYSRLLKRRVSDAEFERATHAARDLKMLPIFIHDRDGMTMAEIAALARSRASQTDGKLGLIIIDHLQIVRPSDRYRGNRVSELTEMTGMAKALAKAIKWPVVLLSQLSRDIERRPEKERMPLLSDLRESGSIEQDADVVIGMLRVAHYIRHRKPAMGERDSDYGKWLAEYEPAKNRLELGIIKNRHGASETLKCFVDIAAGAIRDEDPFDGLSLEAEDLLGAAR